MKEVKNKIWNDSKLLIDPNILRFGHVDTSSHDLDHNLLSWYINLKWRVLFNVPFFWINQVNYFRW